MNKNRFLIPAAFLFASLPFPASAGMASLVKELSAAPGLSDATWTMSVKDCASGKVVYEREPRRNVTPASILKIFVTAAAFDRLGADYKIKTRVYRGGEISGGTLKGNIYIKGAGDPSLGSQFVKDARTAGDTFRLWADALKAAGIKSVDGAVAADESAFDGDQPGSWAWEDIGNYYAARASALTIGDNLYKLYFKPAAKAGGAAELLRTEPALPELAIDNRVLTGPRGSGDNTYIFGFPGSSAAFIKGTVPLGVDEFVIKGALPDPALYAAGAFTAYLAANGISVSGKPLKQAAPSGAVELAATEGSPLEAVVRVTNKHSFNLYAELLLRQLALRRGLYGSSEEGIKLLKEFLAAQGLDVSGMKLDDAAGLSKDDTVKAENFTDLLCAVYKKDYFGKFRDTFVFPNDPDATGHVRRLGANTPLAEELRLKSGSLSGVRSYTGYLKTKKGRTLAFTFILNDYSVDTSGIDKLHERLLLELGGY